MRAAIWLVSFLAACLLAVKANGGAEWIGFGGAPVLWLLRPRRRRS
jgi:hypothetical protein